MITRWLGTPSDSERLIAKGQLAAWARSEPASATLPNYGLDPKDLTSAWTERDAVTLGDFSGWWNIHKGIPQLPKTSSQSLSDVHVYTLKIWAAGQLGQPFPTPGLPAGTPFPPAPVGWPAALPWPLVGPDKPEGWPSEWAWPPTAPTGVPATVPWPLPVPEVVGPPNVLPPPPAPTEKPGELPPPPKTKKASVLPWVLGAVAVGAVMVTAMQPKAGSRRSNPARKPSRSYEDGFKTGQHEESIGEAMTIPAFIPPEEREWWDGYIDGVDRQRYGDIPEY